MKNRTLSLSVSLLVVLLVPTSSQAQLVIPGGVSDTVAIPADRDERSQTLASLQKSEEDFRRSIDRLQEQFRWQVERLEHRRSGLAEQQRNWRSRRASLKRRSAGPRVDQLDQLLGQARVLDRLQRDLQESYDSHLRSLLEGESAARSLQLALEQGAGLDFPQNTTVEIDARIEELDSEISQQQRRVTDLEDSGTTLERSAAKHRDDLNAALLVMFQADDRPEGDVAHAQPGSSPADVDVQDELLSLEDEERRLAVSIREYQGELARARLALLVVEIAKTNLPIDLP